MHILGNMRTVAIALGLALVWCLPHSLHGQSGSPRLYDESVLKSRAIISQLFSDLHLPGLSVAVACSDSIIWSEGFGYADVSIKQRVSTSTKFRIGSVSKLLTATLCALLAERGLLDLDSPVQRYVPSFPEKGRTITIRQLLGHLGGIRHYRRGEYINTVHYETVTSALSIFNEDTLVFEPGSKYGYSSYGYVLASVAAEQGSNRNFLTLVRENILVPCSMISTTPDISDAFDTTRTKYYMPDSTGKAILAPETDNSDRWGAGGFLSTSKDLALFGSAILNGRLLKPSTTRRMFTSQKTSAGKETGVGMGWRIAKDSLGVEYYHHEGEAIGGRAVIVVYPKYNLTVAIAANISFARFDDKVALDIVHQFAR